MFTATRGMGLHPLHPLLKWNTQGNPAGDKHKTLSPHFLVCHKSRAESASYI